VHPATLQPVKDCSAESIRALVELIERSSAPEHFLYREAELDDLWRQVQTSLAPGPTEPAERRRVEDMLAAVMDAHNLVADLKGPAAAARLSEVLSD